MNQQPKQSEACGARTNVKVTLCRCSTPLARALSAAIALAQRLGLRKLMRRLLTVYHAQYAVQRLQAANIVPDAALTLLAKAITGNCAALAEIEVDKSALGTGTAAPVAGDTGLATEVYRKSIASQSYSANVAYNTAFYTAAEVSGTFKEHGIFANNATLISRVLLNAPTGIVKTLTNTLTIEHETTFVFNA